MSLGQSIIVGVDGFHSTIKIVIIKRVSPVARGGNGNNRMLHLKEHFETYEMARLKYLMLWR